eukprot:6603278-Prymnesium_polylepis.2
MKRFATARVKGAKKEPTSAGDAKLQRSKLAATVKEHHTARATADARVAHLEGTLFGRLTPAMRLPLLSEQTAKRESPSMVPIARWHAAPWAKWRQCHLTLRTPANVLGQAVVRPCAVPHARSQPVPRLLADLDVVHGAVTADAGPH